MSDILSNLTHQETRGMCRIVQDVRTCLILTHLWSLRIVQDVRTWSDTPRDQGNVSDCTGCQNLSNLTHQETRGMCRIVQDVRTCLIWHTKRPGECVKIVQDVRTCLIWHTKRPGECVGLYRMSEPVYSDTPRDQGNVLNCTGCQNLSNLTHQETRGMCWVVQDIITCLIWHTKRPGECVGLYRMSEPV